MNQSTWKHGWTSAAAFLLISAMLMATGCGLLESTPETPETYQDGPPPRNLPQRNLKALRNRILENAKKFKTLTASCEAFVWSPLIRSGQRRNQKYVSMEGELYLRKPGKIHLRLYSGGKLYVELTGNGNAYKTNMPIFGNTRYSGQYGDSIRWRPDRLHFMPDDLVDCLDRNDWFANKTQVLRSFREPPNWQIDNLVLEDEPDPSLRIDSSVRIKRRQEQVNSFTKFARDGSVRVESVFGEVQLVQSGDRSVRIPGIIYMRYPIEGTIIRLNLSNIELNVNIKPDKFKL